ncbi:MAG: 5'-3' exonuclease H3TH domain-containing protein [Actinomycetota bacterium]
MIVHLIDGTYELYRQFYGQLGRHTDEQENSGGIGVLNSTLQVIEDGATPLGVATDHVIESFRNDLWPGYKTSEGMEPDILRQIPVLEDALTAMGVTVWAMEEFEADDALASAVRVACEDRRVHQVRLLTPDKDLGQCVSGRRVVQVDRKNDVVIDEAAVKTKFGVGPESIVDYLALVGDSADGFPGLPGWGAKSTSTLLAKYGDIMSIPPDHAQWARDGVKVRGAEKLATALREGREDVELFRILAKLVDTVEVGSVDGWKWTCPLPKFAALTNEWGVAKLGERAETLRRLK